MKKYFEYAHLPQHLQVASKPFCLLAEHLMRLHGNDPEGQAGVALQKLLEAKDAAVRAALDAKGE